jgi:hypothetical protein
MSYRGVEIQDPQNAMLMDEQIGAAKNKNALSKIELEQAQQPPNPRDELVNDSKQIKAIIEQTLPTLDESGADDLFMALGELSPAGKMASESWFKNPAPAGEKLKGLTGRLNPQPQPKPMSEYERGRLDYLNRQSPAQGGGDYQPKPAPGMRNKFNESGELLAQEPIQGSKQYRVDMDKYSKDKLTAKYSDMSAKNISKQVDDLLLNVKGMEGAFGILDSRLPSFREDTVKAETQLNTLKNLLQTTGMQNLKAVASSPGAMSEAEWPKLEAAFGALGRATTVEDAKLALADIKNYSDKKENT